MTFSRQVKFALFATAMMAALALDGCTRSNRVAAMLRSLLPHLQSQTPEDDYREHVIVVCIPIEGRFYVGRTRVNSLEVLRALLQRKLNCLPLDQKAVYLKAASKVSYGEVVKVADVVKSLGIAPRLVT